jgi:undecaprenyl diphosphate synthase
MESASSQIKHLAIIMDGNGRWAQRRSHQRVWGHIRGAARVSEVVEESARLGLNALTLYTFSVENWSRPRQEISTLFKLFGKFLVRERARIIKNNICFKVIGDSTLLPANIQKQISTLESDTADNSGMKLSLAFGYGGREEISAACRQAIANNPTSAVTSQEIEQHLFRPESGDVDLLIRTGGDHRISNFLLWQIAYAELFFTDTPWPEFDSRELRSIIDQAKQRERRFGATEVSLGLDVTHQMAQENRSYFAQQKCEEGRQVENE